MGQWHPCKRRDFIKKLRQLDFEGPYSGARHQFMAYNNQRLAIPSYNEYSVPQLRMMLNEVKEIIGRDITVDEWNKLAS